MEQDNGSQIKPDEAQRANNGEHDRTGDGSGTHNLHTEQAISEAESIQSGVGPGIFRDPITRFVRSFGPGHYMVKEAANLVGVSHWTLRKYIQDNKEGWQPSKFANFGNVTMYIYTEEDVARMREIRTSKIGNYRPVGRPSKYTAEERQIRHRLYARKNYWKKQLEKAELTNNEAEHKKAIATIEEIDQQLETFKSMKEEQL